eukprot:gene16135-19140_t
MTCYDMVLGTPLVATSPPCASLVTGGALQLRVKQLVRFEAQRLHMLFPVKGSAMQGLVAVEARKRKGKLTLKSLTMDPSTVPDGVPTLAEARKAQQEMLKGPLATYNQLKATVNTVVDSPRRVKEKVLEYQRQASVFRDNFMLHVEEQYQMHRLPLLAGGATLGTLTLWRCIVGASSMFIEVTDPYSELSCLVLAAAVAGAGTVAARRTYEPPSGLASGAGKYTIDPEGVMRLALASMKKHPGVVENEVMAALRSSMLHSLDAKPAYDAEDDSEDALAKEANTPKPLSQGGGMYPWE